VLPGRQVREFELSEPKVTFRPVFRRNVTFAAHEANRCAAIASYVHASVETHARNGVEAPTSPQPRYSSACAGLRRCRTRSWNGIPSSHTTTATVVLRNATGIESRKKSTGENEAITPQR
jgi:hypothetical protein